MSVTVKNFDSMAVSHLCNVLAKPWPELVGKTLFLFLFCAWRHVIFLVFHAKLFSISSFFSFCLSLVPFSLGKVFCKALARTCWEDLSQYWERTDQQSRYPWIKLLVGISVGFWLIASFVLHTVGLLISFVAAQN